MLRRRAEKIPGGGTSNQGLDGEFRLLPNESFSCSGTMTGLLLVGTLGTSGKRNQYPEIQIWRNTDGNTYTRQANQEIRLAEGDFSPDGVFQYNLTTLISFQSGDVLGVYQPSTTSSVVRVYYSQENQITFRVTNNPTSPIATPNLLSASDELILMSPISGMSVRMHCDYYSTMHLSHHMQTHPALVISSAVLP